jgi:hypothetical protein
MAIVEDREELSVAREILRESGASEGVGDRVGGKARLALLAVGDDGSPVASSRLIESAAALSCAACSCAQVILPSQAQSEAMKLAQPARSKDRGADRWPCVTGIWAPGAVRSLAAVAKARQAAPGRFRELFDDLD